jgi:hypothetical protein
MPHAIPREMTIRWEATSLAISRHKIETPHCRTCGSALALHQPDKKTPEHLLGTCGDCGGWFLIEVTRGGAKAFLFDLPNVALIRAALVAAEEERKEAKAMSKRKEAAVDGRRNGSATVPAV